MARKVEGKFKTRMILFVPVCICLVIMLSFSIGKYWVEIVDLYEENQKLNEELTTLKEEEATLLVDVNKLQDPDYVARYAREKYFFSGKNEIIFKFNRDN